MRKPSLKLAFPSPLDSSKKARLEYAFKVFAATYGIPVADGGNELVYGTDIAARYGASSSPTTVSFRREAIPVLLGLTTGKPDALGEIFLWLSGEAEAASSVRDANGRVPYSESLFARHGISPKRPWAAIWMEYLADLLVEKTGERYSPARLGDRKHYVVSTHDVDFYHVDRKGTLKRLIKNLAISVLVVKKPQFFFDTLKLLGKMLVGGSVGKFIPELVKKGDELGFRSTFFFLCGGEHRRDANYKIDQLAAEMALLSQNRFDVGVHGSYESVIEKRSLAQEAAALRQVTKVAPVGNRQHWLRFDSGENLGKQVSDGGFLYDSTLGFSETNGFRNGACFAFPPYDFANERAFGFLEFPLVVMDSALVSSRSPEADAREILNESRRWGHGGVSLLWHDPVEPLAVSKKINSLYWRFLAERDRYDESWVSGQEMYEKVSPRFREVGLL